MKKVLSLVLALAMVVGMSSVAFAAFTGTNYAGSAANIGTFKQSATSQSFVLTIPTNAVTAGALAGVGSGGGVSWILESNSSRDSQEIEDFFNLGSARMDMVSGSANKVKVTFTAAKDSNTDKWLPVGNYSFKLTLYDDWDPSNANHSITYSNIKFDVVGTTTSTDTIPSTYKITGIADNWTDFVEGQWKDGLDGTAYAKVTEDITMQFPLVCGMFYWEDQYGDIVYATNITGSAYTPVRATHLKDVKLRKTNTINNSGTVKSVEIDGTNVKIKTVTYFLKCGNTDVALDLDLVYKSAASGDKLYINFNIFNEKVEVDSGDYAVDTTGHVYIQATSSVRDLEMEIGEGLSLFKGFGTDQKAYARVSLELSAGDEKLFQQYPELSDVYTLYTVGVQSANVYAQFNDLDDTYFVYDENFKLLGTTSDKKLAFSNKYYLTTKKVDLAGTSVSDEDSEPASESTPTDIGNAGTGGGGTAVVNNYNPNTGA